jgi:flagellar biosynthesis chaperone FliJ
MSVINLKKLKLEQNSKIASRKLNLKAKSTMSPSQIIQYEKDIKVLEENIILLDIEITKRG